MILIVINPPRFPLGSVVATANAIATFPSQTLQDSLVRHSRGDWGDLSSEDRKANESALGYGGRLLSSYQIPELGKLWIITESDRSVTTLLLPEDY